MHPMVTQLEREYMKPRIPDFRPGDTVRVAVRIIEGDKERIQNYEGLCIARQGSGVNRTFTVRRVSFGVGMERTFLLHSPRVESIKDAMKLAIKDRVGGRSSEVGSIEIGSGFERHFLQPIDLIECPTKKGRHALLIRQRNQQAPLTFI